MSIPGALPMYMIILAALAETIPVDILVDGIPIDIPADVYVIPADVSIIPDNLPDNLLARRQLSPEQIAEVRARQQALARTLRAQKKTQAETAAILGVARRTVDEWESTATSNVKDDNACTPPDLRLRIPTEAYERIAERVAAGESQAQVAADYHVTQQRVGQIAKLVQARQRFEVTRILIDRVALSAADVADPDLPSFRANTKRGDPRWRWFVERYLGVRWCATCCPVAWARCARAIDGDDLGLPTNPHMVRHRLAGTCRRCLRATSGLLLQAEVLSSDDVPHGECLATLLCRSCVPAVAGVAAAEPSP